MQFEKIFINNKNGKVNGYRQKGKYENGKIELSLDEKFGDNKFDNKLIYKTNNNKETSDEEFIKHCENRIANNTMFNNAYELKIKLRRSLENNLNEEVLDDFKVLVNIINSKEKNVENRKVIEQLINKYSRL